MQFTDQNIQEIIAGGAPVVVDIWATWCGPCMAMAPIVDALSKEYEGRVTIGKYNADEEGDFCTEYSVMGLPTVLFFKNGEYVPSLRITGGVKEDVLRSKIEALLAL